MPRKRKPSPNEIIFIIDGFTPKTMPIDRAAKYLEKFAEMIGQENSVHLMSVDQGSCALRAVADDPPIPKLRERAQAINDGTAPQNAIKARREMDDLLAGDNTSGRVTLGGENLIEFPGTKRSPKEEVGPVPRPSSISGSIWSIGGKDNTVNVHLRNRGQDLKCVVTVDMARRLTPYLFGRNVKLFGIGQWYRVDGVWQMRSMAADDFVELDESPLESSIGRIRELYEGVSAVEFMEAMEDLRHG